MGALNNPCCFKEIRLRNTDTENTVIDGCWTDVINETSVQFNNTFHE